MKTYLSFGGGVNSVAMMLLLRDEGWEFENIYVDHGCDWPETHEYIQMLQKKGYPVTIITPLVEGFDNLYDYFWHYKMIPSIFLRICTAKFKVRPLTKHFKKPCFSLIGFSSDEAHRAKINTNKGIENRFPLIEYDINRDKCKEIIKDHDLPVPIKSGCWLCPFQRVGQWRKLRRIHPELFCRAKALEDRNTERRIKQGKKPLYFYGNKSLDVIVNEAQGVLWEELKPPCQCGL